jgi:hypothetical protein
VGLATLKKEGCVGAEGRLRYLVSVIWFGWDKRGMRGALHVYFMKVDEHKNVYDTKDCNAMYLDKEGEDREINVNIVKFFSYIFFFMLALCLIFGYSVGC